MSSEDHSGHRSEFAPSWAEVREAASFRRAFHSTFVSSARIELARWQRCGPGIRQVVATRLGSDSEEIRDLIAAYRRAAVQQQTETVIAAEKISIGYALGLIVAGIALLIGTFSYPATLVVFLTIVVTSALMGLLSDRRLVEKATLVATALIAAGYFLAGGLTWDPGTLGDTGIFGLALFAAGSWVLLIVLSSIVAFRISLLRVRAVQRRHPEVNAITQLLEVIDRAGPIRLRDKGRMVQCLATAASLIETAVPKTLSLPEPAQRLVYADRCRATAASLRSLMLWVALPGPTTHADLIRVCQDTVYALLTGRFDELPALAGDPPTRRQRLRTVLSVARTLITGAIPFLVLIGVRQAGVVVQGTLGDAATIFSIGWAVVVYLQLIDPLMTQRLSSMKDLIGTLRGGLGGK